MAQFIIVVGPPCSGKSTHVAANLQSGDVVIDFDLLAVALGSPVTHDHDPRCVPIVESARMAVVRQWAKRSGAGRAWLVLTYPSQAQRFGPLAVADRVVMETAADVCVERAVANGRHPQTIDTIRRWTIGGSTAPTLNQSRQW